MTLTDKTKDMDVKNICKDTFLLPLKGWTQQCKCYFTLGPTGGQDTNITHRSHFT